MSTENGLSWWEKDFDQNKHAAQARMRNAELPPPIDAYFTEMLTREERENVLPRRPTPSRIPSALTITGFTPNIGLTGTDDGFDANSRSTRLPEGS